MKVDIDAVKHDILSLKDKDTNITDEKELKWFLNIKPLDETAKKRIDDCISTFYESNGDKHAHA